MKFALLIVGMFCFQSAQAGSEMTEALPEAQPLQSIEAVDADLDSHYNGTHDYALEISASAFGEFGGQNISTRENRTERTTDGFVGVTGRKFYTENFDLSFSLPLFAINMTPAKLPSVNGDTYTLVTMKPISVGARYQWTIFQTLKPSLQADFGEAIISSAEKLASANTDAGFGDDTGSYLRAFGKLTAGLDMYFSNKSDFYAGFKVGYLFIKDYGSLNTGLQLGCVF